MSRVGKMPIPMPKGVSFEVDPGNCITVKGPKGQLQQQLPTDIKVELAGSELQIKRPTDDQRHKALHGLTRALVNNMVTGVSSGYVRKLDIEGVGYRGYDGTGSGCHGWFLAPGPDYRAGGDRVRSR